MCAVGALPAAASADGTGVVISEVYGGGGNSGAAWTNDFIELYNPTGVAVDVSHWSVQYASYHGTSWQVTELTGSIPAGGFYLVQEAQGNGGSTSLPTPDVTGTISLSGKHGKVALVPDQAALTCGDDCAGTSAVLDFVGYGAQTSDFEGSGPAPTLSNATSDSRNAAGADTNDNAEDFAEGAPSPSSAGGDGGGEHCTGTMPIADIQGTDTPTSPCVGDTVTTEGVVTAAYPTGGFNGFYLQTAGTGGSPADDPTPGASDAIFVYSYSGARAVQVGDSVTVTGEVQEYQGTTEISAESYGPTDTPLASVAPGVIPWANLNTEAEKEAHEGELISPQGPFTVSGNYNVNYYGTFMLAAGTTTLQQPTDVAPAGSPTAVATAADNASRAITLDDGSSWNYAVFSSHTADPLPWLTHSTPARVGSAVTFHEPVILEYRFDAWSFQPTHHVTGAGSEVATFSNGRPANQYPQDVGGDARLATFNVENYFPMTGERYESQGLGTCDYYTDRAGNEIAVDECTGTDGSLGPRGAANAESLARQQSKIVTGINRLGASIVSLEEVGNSAKFGEPRDTALASLVNALNEAAGRDAWAYVPSPEASDLPPTDQQDVIRVAIIYRPDVVTPVGPSSVLADDSGTGEAFSIGREPQAQAFKAVGAPDAAAFVVVANHFKSKGPDQDELFTDCDSGGDVENTQPGFDQGAFNCTRVHEAVDMTAFAAQVADRVGTDRIFLLGDFNAYTFEDPMQAMYDAGYTDLASSFHVSDASYAYDGMTGSLDHVLASPAALEMVTGVDVWQINAQEAVAFNYSRYNYNVTDLFDGTIPFAASDHNPVVVGMAFPQVLPAWEASTVYHDGDLVNYAGSTWRALWWTQNQAPGRPYGPWEEIVTTADGTAVWTASRIFTAGDVVDYRGERYEAKWWTRNQAPGQPYGPWRALD